MRLRTIIAGWEGGERSRDAVRFASVLARTSGATLVIAHAYRYDTPQHSSDAEARLAVRAAAVERLAEADAYVPYGMRARTTVIEARSPVQGLHDLAVSENADLIVVGATTKGSLELHAVGSVPERLLRGAPCAIAVAPDGYASERDPGLHVVGVAYDGSPESVHALETAAELAKGAGAALKLIGVVERPSEAVTGIATMYAPPDVDGDYRDAMLATLESVADALPVELRAQVVLAIGEAAPEIIERAGILSLLVMGSRGYGPLKRALLGSVSGPVLRAAPCPVMVVPRGAGELAAKPAAEAAG